MYIRVLGHMFLQLQYQLCHHLIILEHTVINLVALVVVIPLVAAVIPLVVLVVNNNTIKYYNIIKKLYLY
jgi:hypothetical protein